MQFELDDGAGSRTIDVALSELIICGWSGRDGAAVQQHIEELSALGVAAPSRTPIYYRVSADRLTQAPQIDVLGEDTSGEVEVVLIGSAAGTLVGLGSDHTDRKAEAYSVALSKQLCPKPIGRTVWHYQTVRAAWDQLRLVARRTIDGTAAVYQDGTMAAVLAPDTLLGGTGIDVAAVPEGTVAFLGTLPAIGPIGGAEHWQMRLEDPARDCHLALDYRVRALALIA